MKSKIIFVGGFNLNNNPSVYGGQVTACRGLINSKLTDEFDFLLIDSTNESYKSRGFLNRLEGAIGRIFRLIKLLSNRKNIVGVFVFSSSGFSLYEKGLMIFISKLFWKRTFFFPRSGLIKWDSERSILFGLYLRLVLKITDHVICQGQYWYNFYEKLVGRSRNKLLIIRNWINVNIVPTEQVVNKRPTPIQVMYMGHFYSYKGIMDFVELAKRSAVQLPHFFFNIYGEGDMKDQVLNAIGGYDTIQYHGPVFGEKKEKAFLKTHIFILPSHVEGFPNSLLESMAYGLCAIATDVGDVASIITDNKNGLLVRPNDVDGLLDKLLYLNKNKNKIFELGQAARELVQDEYGVEKAVTILSNLLKNKENLMISNSKVV